MRGQEHVVGRVGDKTRCQMRQERYGPHIDGAPGQHLGGWNSFGRDADAGLGQRSLHLQHQGLFPPPIGAVFQGHIHAVGIARFSQQLFGLVVVGLVFVGVDCTGNGRVEHGARARALTQKHRLANGRVVGRISHGLTDLDLVKWRVTWVHPHRGPTKPWDAFHLDAVVGTQCCQLLKRDLLCVLHLSGANQRDTGGWGGNLPPNHFCVIGFFEGVIGVHHKHRLLPTLKRLQVIGAKPSRVQGQPLGGVGVFWRGVFLGFDRIKNGGQVQGQRAQKNAVGVTQCVTHLVFRHRFYFVDARSRAHELARALLYRRLFIRPHDVLRCQLVAKGAANVSLQLEGVGFAIGRNGPALGQVGLYF